METSLPRAFIDRRSSPYVAFIDRRSSPYVAFIAFEDYYFDFWLNDEEIDRASIGGPIMASSDYPTEEGIEELGRNDQRFRDMLRAALETMV